jgi:light-regulated signal transduction histidine kinase (bacteriophytochrome)
MTMDLEKLYRAVGAAAQDARDDGELPEALLAELESVVRNFAHDVRSPLGALDSYAGLLEEAYGPAMDEQGRLILRRMSSAVQSAVTLLNDLQTYSRVARQELEVEAVDLAAVARGALEDLQVGGAPPGVDELPSVRADAGLMRVLWLNVLKHALALAAGRADRLAVTSRHSDSEVVCSVRAEGAAGAPGRTQGAASRPAAHGAALAIAGRIVRRHGGRLWIDEDGAGAAVLLSFSIPAA